MRWSQEEIAELKQNLESCHSREELLVKSRRRRPVLTLDGLERFTRRMGISSLVEHFAKRNVNSRRPEHEYKPGNVVTPDEVDIPIAVDLSELPPEEQTRFELKIRALQQKNEQLEAAKEKLLGQLHERDIHLKALTRLGATQAAPIVAPKGRGEGKLRLATPVMLLSDWHVEEPVHPESVNGLNEYNLDIADRCIDKCAEGFEWLTRDKRFEMRKAVIWLGGDLFSGYIHEELQEANFLSPVQACVWLQERIEKMLRRILAETNFEQIIIVCNDGNHGRLTKKIRISTRTENSLEWLLYKTLAKRFAEEPRIHFQIAAGEYNYLDVYDHTLCFFHGDSVRYGGGVGGLLIPMKRGLNEMRKYRKVDSFCFGHFHQYLALQDIAANGSMIGINAYAMSNKFSPEPRQQSFFLIDSEKGKCQSTPIWL